MSKLKEIEDLMARIENYKGIKACSDRSISALLGEIATIEAQSAEEKKPIKRSGDCCLGGGIQPCIIIGNGKDSEILYEEGGTAYKGAEHHVCNCNPLFNAFDEIKALQKNLDQAEFNETHDRPSIIKIKKAAGGRLRITVTFPGTCSTGYINKAERDDFCLEARQIVATMKREESKK